VTATSEAPALELAPATRPRAVVAVLGRHLLLLSVLLAALTCPFASATPSFDLDFSWGFAAHAWVSGSAGDVPVTYFTYGPLGFLAVPVVWGRSTYAFALLFSLGVQVALCRLLLARLLRLVTLPVAVLVVLAVAALVDTSTPELMLIAVTLAAAELLQGGTRHPRAWLLAGTALSGLALLVKFSSGLVCLGVLVLVTALLAGPGLRRRIGTAAGAGAASVLVSWVAFGAVTGHPDAFWTWVRASTEIASGYVAMAYEYYDGSTTADYGYAVPLTAGLVLLAALLALRARALPQAGSALVLALVVYLMFREGLTRHDPVHLRIVTTALLVLPFALVLGRRTRWLLAPLVLLAFGFGVWQTHELHPGQRYDLAGNVSRLANRVGLVADARSTQDRGRRVIQDNFQVPGPVLDALRGHRVQVDPFDTGAVWAYGLRWGPASVWALYSSYTPWLDDHNAASLRAATGPDRVLRRVSTAAVDGRQPAFESPAYQLEELCRWRRVVTSGMWEVLERGPDRCGAPTRLGTARLVPGQPVVIPRPTVPGSVVTVRLLLDLPLRYRLESALFKPWTPRTVVLDGRRYRLVVRTAGQPLAVVVPATLSGVPGSPGGFSSSTLTVDLAGTAVFEEHPVSPTP
jgi:hypothetical protein